jgi:hypothetical protein
MNTKKALISEAENVLAIIIYIDLVSARMCYYATETGEWYWLTQEDLELAVALADDTDEDIQRDVYSHWASLTGGLASPEDQIRLNKEVA